MRNGSGTVTLKAFQTYRMYYRLTALSGIDKNNAWSKSDNIAIKKQEKYNTVSQIQEMNIKEDKVLKDTKYIL